MPNLAYYKGKVSRLQGQVIACEPGRHATELYRALLFAQNRVKRIEERVLIQKG